MNEEHQSKQHSNRHNRFAGLFFIFFTLSLIAAQGCGGPNSKKVLRFFFDGVPSSDSNYVGADTINNRRALRDAERQASIDSLNKLNEFQTHPPYADRDCSACHNMPEKKRGANGLSFSPGQEGELTSWLTLPIEALCFKCHDDKTEEYAEANGMMIHDPVASGECVTCHHPHRSRNASLLLTETARELCLECHDESIPEGEDDHPELEDSDDCTDCHNPHLSEDEFLLN